MGVIDTVDKGEYQIAETPPSTDSPEQTSKKMLTNLIENYSKDALGSPNKLDSNAVNAKL